MTDTSLPPPPPLARVVMQGGAVSVLAPASLVPDDLCLAVDGVELPFRPLGPEAARDPDLLWPAPFAVAADRFRAVPIDGGRILLDETLAEACRLRVDALRGWRLDGHATLQAAVRETELSFALVHADPLRLPPSDAALELTVAAAVHRGEAEVAVLLAPEDGGPTQVLRAPIDPAKAGGTLLAAYDLVRIAIPPRDAPVEATLAVLFTRGTAGPMEPAPHIFVARPRIAPPGFEDGPLAPLRLRGPVTLREGQWLRAEVSPYDLGPDSRVVLRSPGAETLLLGPARARVAMEGDTGTALYLSASEEGTFALYLDGRPARAVSLGPRSRAVRLPSAALTGAPVHVTVRDATGSRVLLETWCLPVRATGLAGTLVRESRPPFPGELFAQAAHRYDGLKRHLAAGPSGEAAAQLSRALAALEAGPEHLTPVPLAFPEVGAPDVSVVVCAHDHFSATYACLCALLLAHCETSFEVILVDDGSTDATARIGETVSGLRVIRLEGPQGFLAAANAGAAEARGRHIAFLNNDTEPTAGWLDALRDAFDRFDDVGLAGARLVYPDGKLQEAGGIVWRTGDPANYGRGQSPWDPRFRYARRADYVSGAAMMTPRDLWQRLGGFDTAYAPMYFEDTDYAFRVREAGRSVWVIPSATVYHAEGTTAGTDPAEGAKRHQEENRPRFKRRWAAACATHGAPGSDPDLEKDRGQIGRILCIDYTTPRPDIDAGGHAAVTEMRLMRRLGYKVTFLPNDTHHAGVYTDALERDGIEVLTAPHVLSAEEALATRGREFDAVYVTRYQTGRLIPRIREHCPGAKVILNLADLHFLRELRGGIEAGDPVRIAAAERTREEELAVIRQADLVLSYTATERAVIDSHVAGAVPARACPWVVAPRAPVPGREGRSGLAFLGNYGHWPNVEGAQWFVREVVPRLEGEGTVLSLYGSTMGDEVRALAGPRVRAVGHVARLADVFDPHLVFVAPLRSGAGIKGKVLEALAHGVPSVLSPVAAEGIGIADGVQALIAETPADWADAIARLERDADLWHRISAAGQALVRERYGEARGLAAMRAALEEVGLYGPAAEAPAPPAAEPAPQPAEPAVRTGAPERTAILHLHLFKCAGTSFDAVLERNFPGRVARAEFGEGEAETTEAAAAWIASMPGAAAFSTHTLRGPLPEVPGVRLLPVAFLRDPLERIRSAWIFERGQEGADTLGARLARETDLAGYVRARLATPGDRQCRNFQTGRLASLVPGPEPELERAIRALDLLALAGLVERFDESLARLARRLRPQLPGFDPVPEHLNRQPDGAVEGDGLPDDLRAELEAANADDLHLLDLVRRRWTAG